MSMLFLPIFLRSEPEQPPFQSTLTIPKSEWSRAKDKILTVLDSFGFDMRYIEDGTYFEGRRSFSEGAGILTGFFVGIFITALGILGYIPFTQEVTAIEQWGLDWRVPSYTTTKTVTAWWIIALWIISIFAFAILSGYLTGRYYAKVDPYRPVDWINVNVGKRNVYIDFEDYSKSWLNNFMDDLEEEGLEIRKEAKQ